MWNWILKLFFANVLRWRFPRPDATYIGNSSQCGSLGEGRRWRMRMILGEGGTRQTWLRERGDWPCQITLDPNPPSSHASITWGHLDLHQWFIWHRSKYYSPLEVAGLQQGERGKISPYSELCSSHLLICAVYGELACLYQCRFGWWCLWIKVLQNCYKLLELSCACRKHCAVKHYSCRKLQ